MLATVIPISNDIYDDLEKIEEDEAFEEAPLVWERLKENPYLGEPLNDREDLDIFLDGCYKVYFYGTKYRYVYTINEDNEVVVLVIAIGQRNNLEVYHTANERLN